MYAMIPCWEWLCRRHRQASLSCRTANETHRSLKIRQNRGKILLIHRDAVRWKATVHNATSPQRRGWLVQVLTALCTTRYPTPGHGEDEGRWISMPALLH